MIGLDGTTCGGVHQTTHAGTAPLKADLQSFFAQVRSTSAQYISLSEETPCQEKVPWVYKFDGKRFAKTDIAWEDPYDAADGDKSDLFAAPLTHFSPTDPYRAYLVSTTQKPPAWAKKKGDGYWYWDFAGPFNDQFPNPGLVTQAEKKFAGMRESSEQYSNHLRSFADADYYEEKIIEAMTKGAK